MDKIQKIYKTPRAFRIAMSDRVRKTARESGQPYEDIYRRIAMDRLLARVDWNEWMAKGGYVLQMRLPNARRTKDVDLSITSGTFWNKDNEDLESALLAKLQEMSRRDVGDYFSFEVAFDRFLPAFGKGGIRCIARCLVDGQLWSTFQVDAIVQDQTVFPAEPLEGDNFLVFAGVEPVNLKVPPKEEVFAEKMHAYTTPREMENTRVKDLLDIALLIESGLDTTNARAAVLGVFKIRGTHAPPAVLPQPPDSWESIFSSLASEARVRLTLQQALEVSAQFYRRLGI